MDTNMGTDMRGSTPALSTGARDAASRRRRASRLLALLLLLLLLLLAACGRNDGISRADADAILTQIQEVGTRLDAVEQRLLQLGQGADPQPAQLISEVRQVGADLGEARAMLNDVGDQIAQATAEPAIEDPLNDPFNDFNDPLDDPFGSPSDDPFDDSLDSPLDTPSTPDSFEPGPSNLDGL